MKQRLASLTLKSFAKVNLHLQVLNRRKDNYHNLRTLFCRISLADGITLKERKDGIIKIKCRSRQVPRDSSNLCYRAAQLLRQEFKPGRGVEIRIAKRIPPGAGLGGGSSNAASVLTGLNKLWRLGLSKDKLARLGAKLGADVPFFIYDAKFALGAGRGDKIKVLSGLSGKKLWFILVFPGFKVSTPLIYRKWGRFSRLTRQARDVKMLPSSVWRKEGFFPVRSFFNDLEVVTTRLYPQVKRVKEALQQMGLESAMMSGSGPAVFASCSGTKEAARLSVQLRRKNRGWQVFAVRAL